MSTPWFHRLRPPPRKNCSAKRRTCNWSSKPLTLEPSATRAKPEKGCCNSKGTSSARAWQKLTNSCRNARQLLDQARDRRGELRQPLPNWNPIPVHGGNLPERTRHRAGHIARRFHNRFALRATNLPPEDQLYRDMRAKLEAMGPVNMMALEEYSETTERHTFLDTQRKDLISSIENTTATIRRD